MVNHMRYCTNMEKGAPYMAETALNCKKEVRHSFKYKYSCLYICCMNT